MLFTYRLLVSGRNSTILRAGTEALWPRVSGLNQQERGSR